MDILNWELIGIAVGIIASVLGGVWFIIHKAFGIGRFSNRVEEMDKRTCHASCEPHGKDIDSLKYDNQNLKQGIASISQTLSIHSKDIDKLKEDVQCIKTDVGKMSQSLSTHSKDIESFKADMKEIKDNLANISSFLAIKYKDVAPIFSRKQSPRQLNETGLRLFADIDGNAFLCKNRDFLFNKIDKCNPHTALDVENAAYYACTAYTDNEIFNGIKNFVYNSPSYPIKAEDGSERKYDLALPDVCFVLSLPLRDMYLAAHPEIPTE